MTAEPLSRRMPASNEAADVDAFVRQAVEAVHQLVSDGEIATELLDSIWHSAAPGSSAPSASSVDRLLAAQQVLARVLSHERATLGEPLSADDLEAALRGRRLDVEDSTRWLYELSLGRGRSWGAIGVARRGEPQGDPSTDSPAQDPLIESLRILVSRSDARNLPHSVRKAAADAHSTPLGFCRLALEVADAMGEIQRGDVRAGSSPLARLSVLLDDPFLRRESERAWFDLRARSAIYLADRSRRQGRLEACDAQLASLPEFLAGGTGAPDLQARYHELRAGRDLAAGHRAGALDSLRRAEDILRNASADKPGRAKHHLVEVRLKRALVLAADPSDRARARTELAALAVALDGLGDLDEALRLRVFLAGARVELDLARQAVAELDPLGSADDSEHSAATPATALAAYAEAWQAQASTLDEARSWLNSAEPLLDLDVDAVAASASGVDRQRAEYAWFLGQSLLLRDRRQAADLLRQALADFRRLGDEASVERASIDLIVCGVLSGALGDEIPQGADDWSEPLRLFRELAARTLSG